MANRFTLQHTLHIILFALALMFMAQNVFAQTAKPNDIRRVKVKALNEAMTLQDFLKCDLALVMYDSVEKGYIDEKASEKWFRFVLIIVLESEQSKNFGEVDYWRMRSVENENRSISAKDLEKLVKDCERTLTPFMLSNKLYNDIFVNKSLDYLSLFREPSRSSPIKFSLSDYLHCRAMVSKTESVLYRTSNLEKASRVNSVLLYLSNVQMRQLIKEMKYSDTQLKIISRLLSDQGRDYSKYDIDAETKKCAEVIKLSMNKELSTLLSNTENKNGVRSSRRFYQKSSCVYTQSIQVDILNEKGSVVTAMRSDIDLDFTNIDNIFYSLTKDMSQYSETTDAILRNMVKNTPYAIFLSSKNSSFVTSRSSFRSSINSAANDNTIKKERFWFFLFADEEERNKVKPILDAIALACEK